MGFRLLPKSVTLNDLERRNGRVFCVISPNSVSLWLFAVAEFLVTSVQSMWISVIPCIDYSCEKMPQSTFSAGTLASAVSYTNRHLAQLSQRDRAAGLVSFGQKWKTGTERQYFADIICLPSTTVTQLASKAIEFGEKKRKIKAITPFKVIQCHLKSSRMVSIESPYATSC